MKLASITLLALLAVLVPTAGASAVRVPPGNSAATQYSETVPGAGGEEGGRKTNAGKSSGGQEGGGAKSSVPATTATEFEELGPEGKAALNFTNSSGTGGDGGKDYGDKEGGAVATGPGDSGTPGGAGLSAESSGSSGVSEVLGGAVGMSGGGLDFLQPLILAMILVGAGAYILRRRIRRPI